MPSSPLYLVPSHSDSDTRSFPLSLGRRELAVWWWTSCPCLGHSTRKPCSSCRRLGQNVKSLSKECFVVNQHGELSISTRCKSPTLVRVNGQLVFHPVELKKNDVISVGRDRSAPWMTLEVKEKRVVTPETLHFPPKKRFIRMFAQVSNHHGDSPVLDKPDNGPLSANRSSLARASASWLKTPKKPLAVPSGSTSPIGTRPRRQLLFSQSSSSCSAAILPRVIPQSIVRRKRILEGDYDASSPRKRRHKSVNAWIQALRQEEQEQSSLSSGPPQTNSPAEQQDQKSSGSLSSSLKPMTQNIIRPSSPCPGKDESALSLPECPTFEASMEESQLIRDSSAVRVESNEHVTEQVSEVDENQVKGTLSGTNICRRVKTLTTDEWRNIRRQKGSAVRRSLARLIVAQRLKGDDNWLPSMIKNAVIETTSTLDVVND